MEKNLAIVLQVIRSSQFKSRLHHSQTLYFRFGNKTFFLGGHLFFSERLVLVRPFEP